MDARFIDDMNFKVEKLSTGLTFNDLIVNENTTASLSKLKQHITTAKSNKEITRSLEKNPTGYRAVFSGPPGTGKTMAACVLAREAELEVYRIDLNAVVSKYIGETEKNLSRLFSNAESSGVILFFDEADALFGKRTEVKDAHDRYASQEISYLLQRIEEFKGIIILASNAAPDHESPFLRKMDIVVNFEKPGLHQRLELWKKYLPAPLLQEMEPDVDEVARKYELTGGEIVHTIDRAAKSSRSNLSRAPLLRELQKTVAARRER